MTTGEQWRQALAGENCEAKTAALKEISQSEAVSGLTAIIVQLAGCRDDELRTWAAEALDRAVEPTVDETDELSRLLDGGDDGEVGYWAATMLGRLGHQAAQSVPSLERCLRESMYLPAREQAAWALRQIGPQAHAAIPTLQAAAKGSPPRLSRMAAEALRVIHAAA